MSANFGPELLAVDVDLMPALALAVDQSEPKASPPADDDLLWAGLPNEVLDAIAGLVPIAGEGWEDAVEATGTEVK